MDNFDIDIDDYMSLFDPTQEPMSLADEANNKYKLNPAQVKY